jgi:hypothetical protein
MLISSKWPATVSIKLQGNTIKTCIAMNMQGIIIDSKLTWKPPVAQAITK